MTLEEVDGYLARQGYEPAVRLIVMCSLDALEVCAAAEGRRNMLQKILRVIRNEGMAAGRAGCRGLRLIRGGKGPAE